MFILGCDSRVSGRDDDDPTRTIAIGKCFPKQAFGQMTGALRGEKCKLFRFSNSFEAWIGNERADHRSDPSDQDRWPGTDDELAELRKHLIFS